MAQIRLENVSFGYTDTLFEDVNLTISDKDRVAIVGINGGGKSTLLKCIAGEIEPQKGRVTLPKGMKPSYIEQDVPAVLQGKSLYDVISAAMPAEERDYNSWKIDAALDTFKAPESICSKPISELSGGWQRLALIVRAWVSDPDALLLDEPTNHLDVAKIFALEKWLNGQVSGIPVIVISHDRSFLDDCTNKTLFLRSGHISQYNYPYTRAKELLVEDDKTAITRREAELKELERLRRSAHELRQIGVNNFSDTALRKSVQIAKRAEAVEANLTDVYTEAKRDIQLSNGGIQAKRLIGLKDLMINTPDGVPLFQVDCLDIMQGDRLVVFGANGAGKTQMLKYIREAFADMERAKEKGISITPSIKLGYIDQHLSQLPINKSLLDYFLHEFSLGNQKTIGVLVNAGFPVSFQNTKIGSLSHGQRARVALLAFRLMEPNFYIMDEPTNHLDISGQEQLESEILRHGASCLLVSHDRTFCENLGTKFYAIENHHLVQIDAPEIFYERLLDLPDIDED